MEAAAAQTANRPPPRAEPPAQLGFGLFMLFVLSIVCAPFYIEKVATDAPRAQNGRLDLTRWGELKQPVALQGDWAFTWLGGLKPGGPPAGSRYAMRVPGIWEGQPGPGGIETPGRGRALYTLTISGLRPGPYRLVFPTIYTANRVSIDGVPVAQRGRLGRDAKTTRYDWRAHDLGFAATGAPVTIAVEMAAHLHRDSGFEQVPVLGRAQGMADWFALRWSQELLFHISLVLLGLYSLVAFIFRRADWPSLCFALCCFGLLPFSAILGLDNLFLMAFPGVGLLPLMTILYVFTIAALGGFLIYADALFPAERIRWSYRIAAGSVVLLLTAQVAALATGDTWLASKVNSFLLYVILIVFAHVIAVLIRAVARRRPGAVVFLLGIVMLFVTLIVLALVGFGIIASSDVGLDLTSFGMLVLLFSHMVVLAERWSLATVSAETLSRDLRQLLDVNSSITSEMELEALLTRIVEVNSRMLRAERSSLLLHDEKTRELWALVAEGVGKRVIRFPADTGIAGRVFASGKPAFVPDAYDDPDFNREIDELTGFKTRDIIAMPISTREGRRIGVLQALNRTGGGTFDAFDLDRMRAFAAQAAIAIDNATLFSEVIASRNYNESILSSMSSGVVTLDPQLRIAKFNAAACRILKTEEGRLEGLDARQALSVANAGLVAELDAVSASGEPKLLLDADLVTYGGNTISANISIVPLVSEGEDVGLLILFEDISEGKRLQGAMRRFMPQQVVEQVLGREDDLMFGSACRASVLFADIRNFTSMTEKLTPRETVDMLNEVFTELFEAVASTHGILDKYIGDAVMAVYGVPFAGERDARNAVDAGVAMQRMIDEINVRRGADGRSMLNLGVGIATGEVVAGTVGSPKRMDYTVIGDSVNLAARLQDLTKVYRCGVLVDAQTAREVQASHVLREIDTVQVRGREAMEPLFEVVVPRAGLEGEQLIAFLDLYQTGRARLARHDWEGAVEAFDGVLAGHPDDGPATLMRERALSGSVA